MNEQQKCAKSAERPAVSFEIVINRLSQIEIRQGVLIRRAHEKSMRINNTGSPIQSLEEKEQPESVISILNKIMNHMDDNSLILEQVVSDLENSIM